MACVNETRRIVILCVLLILFIGMQATTSSWIEVKPIKMTDCNSPFAFTYIQSPKKFDCAKIVSPPTAKIINGVADMYIQNLTNRLIPSIKCTIEVHRRCSYNIAWLKHEENKTFVQFEFRKHNSGGVFECESD
ncbi:hypothetical protein CAEBREN_20745 [Caenorhabditis brenneri]|uniref:Ig-like domain-containing protein n=1 Tax=Caenorhabditis brenneri TaxID=135651 RepID=G0MCF0_CAEBE|nr:hypothetical protein CAEBREN_20745 [Caenorhabditis brenneri]